MLKFLDIVAFHANRISQNGGVALYVKSGLIPTPRPDLGKDSTNFEAAWVEVENRNGKNV